MIHGRCLVPDSVPIRVFGCCPPANPAGPRGAGHRDQGLGLAGALRGCAVWGAGRRGSWRGVGGGHPLGLAGSRSPSHSRPSSVPRFGEVEAGKSGRAVGGEGARGDLSSPLQRCGTRAPAGRAGPESPPRPRLIPPKLRETTFPAVKCRPTLCPFFDSENHFLRENES